MNTRAVYQGSGRIAIAQVPDPVAGPGEVLLTPSFTGICGSDLHALHGAFDDRMELPAVMGHETVGRVAGVGPDVEGWSVGDRATVLTAIGCGHCAACVDGRPNICVRVRILGIEAPGSLQEKWVVPAGQLVRVPDAISDEHAAVIEPLAVAVHDVARAELRGGENVAIVGAGPVGVLVALVARAAGAQVVLADINEARLELARSLGFDAVAAGELEAYVLERAVDGFAVSFEVTGVAAGLDASVAVLRPRGRLILVGVHPGPRSVDMSRVFRRELELRGARMHTREDYERAIELLESGAVDVRPMISRVLPLEDTERAFTALNDAPDVMKVLIDSRPER
jgi:2-desacetyl-2-hydroxyethyl bacteriochlorophyllide A dehydrogenase